MPTVKVVMATEVQWVVKGALVRSAAAVMERFQIGSVLVAGDEGDPIGILTETDLVRRVIAADLHPWATRVEAVMTPSVVTVDEERSVADAADLMASRAIRHLAVTRDGRVVGMLSARDLLGIETPSPALVEGAMTRLLAAIHLHATVRDAAARMGEASVGALLVTGRRAKHRPGQLSAARQGDIAGVLTETDLVRKLVATDHYPYVTTVAQVMETPLRTLGVHESISAARAAMAKERIRHLVVADGSEIVGLLSARDIIGALGKRDDGHAVRKVGA
jgi:signal-transduction protein with cAMP-binding, CBS, and nucleotidyltransferase domain